MIGDGALFPGERGIVDDRRLFAAPFQDMPVDGVPAGIADAAGEPASVNARTRVEHLLRRLDPVDVPRRFAPETLRIALPARIDLVIAARAGIHGATPSHRLTLGRGRPRRHEATHPSLSRPLCDEP